MRKVVLPRVRWAVPVAAGLVSCLHTLAPKVPPSQTLTLRLSESVAGPHGRAPLAVVAAGPRGVVNIGSDPGITVVFNRSMRPVQSSPTAQLPAIAVTTQEGKPIEGQWRWVGTHGLLFQPARSLPGATRFYVTVPHGTQALDASRLSTDYTLEFATDSARVSRTFPDDSSRRLMPHDALFLKYTQPVDPAELQKHLRLVVRSPGEKLGRELPVAI